MDQVEGRDHLRGVFRRASRSPSNLRRRSQRTSISTGTSRSTSGSRRAVPGSCVTALIADWEDGRCRPAMLSPDRSVHGLLVLERAAVRNDPVGRGVSRSARQTRRGRGDPGLAGALRHPLCGLRRPEFCALHGQIPRLSRRAKRGDCNAEFLDVSRRTRPLIPTGFTYPVFVKPARSGSSFGVSKVSRREELPSAVEAARQYDSKVLIEEAVVGSEVGCASSGTTRI